MNGINKNEQYKNLSGPGILVRKPLSCEPLIAFRFREPIPATPLGSQLGNAKTQQLKKLRRFVSFCY